MIERRTKQVRIVTLAFFVLAAIYVAVILYRHSSLQRLRNTTISRLSWGGGSAFDQASLEEARSYVSSASRTQLLTPALVWVDVYPHRDYFCMIAARWVSLAPVADSIELLFSDGSTEVVVIDEAYRKVNRAESKSILFFEATVLPHNRTKEDRSIELLRGVRLYAEGVPCSEVFRNLNFHLP